MSSKEFPNIASEPNYEPTPDSPKLNEGDFRVDFKTRAARGERGSVTVALFATCRVPGRYADIYGARLQGAIRIVAVDSATGHVFSNNAEVSHTVPLSAVMNPDPAPAPPGVAQTASATFNFNVDLRAQLRLPKEEARYAVFLWLDEMTSPVHVVDLPGPKREASHLLPAPEEFAFRKTDASPNPKRSKIVLTHQGGTQIYGALNSSLFSAKKKETGDRLALLALDFRSRRLRWQSVALPEEAAPKQGYYFDFNLFKLAGEFEGGITQPWQKLFVLAYTRDALSEVLTVSLLRE